MKKITILIADSDQGYLKQLTSYLVNNHPRFDVVSFGKKDGLVSYLEKHREIIDVVLLDENMKCLETDACNASTKLLLVENIGSSNNGYQEIRKYQKLSILVNSIVLEYGKATGTSDALSKGAKKTRCIGVYSPVGGCGKTTLSILVAHALGVQQRKVFYLNYEHVDSTREILPRKAQISFSDLLLMIHSGEQGLGLRLLSGVHTSQDLSFYYINPSDSSLELNEIPIEEQRSLLSDVIDMAQFDDIIVDFDSELNGDKISLLQLCDRIIIPFVPSPVSMSKFLRFFKELSLHEETSSIAGKGVFVGNKMIHGIENYLRRSGLYENCTPAAMFPVSNTFANIGIGLQDAGDTYAGIQSILAQL